MVMTFLFVFAGSRFGDRRGCLRLAGYTGRAHNSSPAHRRPVLFAYFCIPFFHLEGGWMVLQLIHRPVGPPVTERASASGAWTPFSSFFDALL